MAQAAHNVKVKKPRPGRVGKVRRTLGWTLLTLGLLVAAVWVASMVWSVNGGVWGWHGMCNRGQVTTGFDSRFNNSFSGYLESNTMIPEARGFRGVCWRVEMGTSRVKSGTDLWVAWFDHHRTAKVHAYAAQFVLWPLPLLLLPTGAVLVRSGTTAYRRAVNVCLKCGYSLAGLASGAPCPECGKGAKVTA